MNYDNFNYIIVALHKTVNRTKHRIFNNLDTTYLFCISFFQLCKLFRNSVGHFILFFSCISIRDSNDHCANNCIGASIQNCIIKTVQVLTTSFSILQRAIYLDCTTSVCSFGYRGVSIRIDARRFSKFLLDIKLSHTAKLLYALLLDRAILSRQNNWTDEQDRIYVIYPIPKLAQTLGCSFSSITRSLTELTNAGLIERTRSGFSKPSRIFLKIPHTAQKCAATLRISGSSDCAEMTNMIVQKCPPNYLNKNKLSFNHPTEQRNVPLYEFREGESL